MIFLIMSILLQISSAKNIECNHVDGEPTGTCIDGGHDSYIFICNNGSDTIIKRSYIYDDCTGQYSDENYTATSNYNCQGTDPLDSDKCQIAIMDYGTECYDSYTYTLQFVEGVCVDGVMYECNARGDLFEIYYENITCSGDPWYDTNFYWLADSDDCFRIFCAGATLNKTYPGFSNGGDCNYVQYDQVFAIDACNSYTDNGIFESFQFLCGVDGGDTVTKRNYMNNTNCSGTNYTDIDYTHQSYFNCLGSADDCINVIVSSFGCDLTHEYQYTYVADLCNKG
eukprot:502711_1